MNIELILVILFSILSLDIKADDLRINVMGSETDEDYISKMEIDEDTEPSPYLINKKDTGEISKGESVLSPNLPNHESNEVEKIKLKEYSQYSESGYTVPGTFEKNENYLEIDKDKYTKDLHKAAESAWSLVYFRDTYNYDSPNNVIENTITKGYKHVQAGFLTFRSDRYMFQSFITNLFWSMGSGLSYNSGRGIFVDGTQSDSVFRLWEIPLDLGLGIDIPIYKWFKISAAGGPSALGLIQNRGDLTDHEPGKNKLQVGLGMYTSLQFKISLSSFSSESSYDLFSESQISNMFLTLETRYQNYSQFLEQIKISGTSLGLGVTFELL